MGCRGIHNIGPILYYSNDSFIHGRSFDDSRTLIGKIPDMRHHLMHASMVMALLMVLGGARVFADFSDMSNLAISSHIILIFVGATFMICGIMSFRAARLAREAE